MVVVIQWFVLAVLLGLGRGGRSRNRPKKVSAIFARVRVRRNGDTADKAPTVHYTYTTDGIYIQIWLFTLYILYIYGYRVFIYCFACIDFFSPFRKITFVL